MIWSNYIFHKLPHGWYWYPTFFKSCYIGQLWLERYDWTGLPTTNQQRNHAELTSKSEPMKDFSLDILRSVEIMSILLVLPGMLPYLQYPRHPNTFWGSVWKNPQTSPETGLFFGVPFTPGLTWLEDGDWVSTAVILILYSCSFASMKLRSHWIKNKPTGRWWQLKINSNIFYFHP